MIFEYHNGGSNFSGLQFYHTSATFEEKGPSIVAISDMFKNELISTMPSDFLDLENTGIVFLKDLHKKEDNPFFNKFINSGVKNLVICSLNGVDSELGFVVLTYESMIRMSNKSINGQLVKYAQKLANLIDYKVYMNGNKRK